MFCLQEIYDFLQKYFCGGLNIEGKTFPSWRGKRYFQGIKCLRFFFFVPVSWASFFERWTWWHHQSLRVSSAMCKACPHLSFWVCACKATSRPASDAFFTVPPKAFPSGNSKSLSRQMKSLKSWSGHRKKWKWFFYKKPKGILTLLSCFEWV